MSKTRALYVSDTIIGGPIVDVRYYSGLAAAITAIGGDSKTLLISDTETLTGNLTIPSNVILLFNSNGMISIPAGLLLTINSSFDVGIRQVFDGDGTVAFGDSCVKGVIPQWFGTTGVAGSYTDETEINKAITSAGMGGTILFYGDYYLGAGVTMAKAQQWKGYGSDPVGGGEVPSSLIFNITNGVAVATVGYVTIRDLKIVGLYPDLAGTTATGVYVDGSGGTPSSLSAYKVNITGFYTNLHMLQSWYSCLYGCDLSYPSVNGRACVVDYCYNVSVYGIRIGHSPYGFVLSNGASVRLYGGSIEGFSTVGGISLSGTNTNITCVGVYFEGAVHGYCIVAGSSTSVTCMACHVYMSVCDRFITASGNTNVNIVSIGNKIIYQANTDTTARDVYVLPTSGQVNIFGDNWDPTTHTNVEYIANLSSVLPAAFYNVKMPWQFTGAANYIGLPIRTPSSNGIVGTVTLTAGVTTTTVNNTSVTTTSRIFLFPTTANAADDFSAMYISAKVAGTSFTITHPNDGDVDKTFNYLILN